MTRGQRLGPVLAATGILLVASACASGPRPARPGNPLRVTTIAGDTVTGEMVVVRADTLVLAREGIGVKALPLGTIQTVEVDRSRVRSWSRPVNCFVAGVGVATTAYEIAEYGWDLDLVPGVLMFGLLGWDCIDTRPDWKPARLEEGPRARVAAPRPAGCYEVEISEWVPPFPPALRELPIPARVRLREDPDPDGRGGSRGRAVDVLEARDADWPLERPDRMQVWSVQGDTVVVHLSGPIGGYQLLLRPGGPETARSLQGTITAWDEYESPAEEPDPKAPVRLRPVPCEDGARRSGSD